MTVSGGTRLTARLTVLPMLLVGAAVAGGALAPAAHAAGNGTWATPAAGSTVSGKTVPLQFSTSDGTVTFVLPYGSETATVSGGVATGTFDSTRVANGTVTLGATECNVLNMCDTVNETVTVGNPVAQPLPTFSPAVGATVRPGDTVTVGGSGTVELIVLIDSMVQSTSNVTLPYAYQVPTQNEGSHQLDLRVSGAGSVTDGNFTIVAPDSTPPVISKLSYPKSYFPFRDGYLDHFYAIFSVNEAATAVLAISKGGKVVSSGSLPVTSSGLLDLRAGDRLKPGTYTWQLIVTDSAGNVTTTPARTVKADARHLIGHRASLSVSAAASPSKTFANGCGTFHKAGGAVVLDSSHCEAGYAVANFFPALTSAIDYSGITVTVHSTGSGELSYVNFVSGKFSAVKSLRSGSTTLRLTDLDVGYPRPEFLVEIAAAPGKKVTVSSIAASYTFDTLSK